MRESLTQFTLIYVILLLALGIIGYFVTGRQSVTALIPAFFGVVVWLVSFVLGRSASPSVTVWVLFVLGVVGIIATAGGVTQTMSLFGGKEVARPAAAVSRAIMALLSVAYSVVCIVLALRKQ